MTSYWYSIVTMGLSHVVTHGLLMVSCSFWHLMSKKYQDLEFPVKGQSRSLKMVPFDRLDMVSYECSIVTLSLRCTVLEIFRYLKSKMLWPWKTGQGPVKVNDNVTMWYSAYDFLLMFYSNYGSTLWHGHWKYHHLIECIRLSINVP